VPRTHWKILIYTVAATLAATTGAQARVCAGANCPRQIDITKVQRLIGNLLIAQTGAQVRSITCPRIVVARRGASFTCTAMGVDRTVVAVLITQRDENGNVRVTAPNLLHSGQIATALAKRLSLSTKLAVRVRCPDLLNVHKGTALTCTATPPSGAARKVAVTITDARGTYSYRLR